MAERPHSFTREGAKRIVEVVRAAEAKLDDRPRQKNRPPMYMPANQFRQCVLMDAEPIDEEEEPFPTRWRAKYREVECYFNASDIPIWRIKENGWQSDDEDKRTWAIMVWEQVDPCEMENPDCSEETPPDSEDLCSHQSFDPDSNFTKGHLKRMEPVPVEDFESCYERPPIYYIERLRPARHNGEAPCNPPTGGEPQPKFIAMAIGPLRACTTCEG